MASARCRLYLITPPQLEPDFGESLKRALGAGDVACVQLRPKDASDDEFRRAARSKARPDNACSPNGAALT